MPVVVAELPVVKRLAVVGVCARLKQERGERESVRVLGLADL